MWNFLVSELAVGIQTARCWRNKQHTSIRTYWALHLVNFLISRSGWTDFFLSLSRCGRRRVVRRRCATAPRPCALPRWVPAPWLGLELGAWRYWTVRAPLVLPARMFPPSIRRQHQPQGGASHRPASSCQILTGKKTSAGHTPFYPSTNLLIISLHLALFWLKCTSVFWARMVIRALMYLYCTEMYLQTMPLLYTQTNVLTAHIPVLNVTL